MRATCRRQIMKRRWDGDHVLMDSTRNGKRRWSLACWKQASFRSLVSIAPIHVSVAWFHHSAHQVGTGRLNWASEKTLADYIYKRSDPNKKDQRDETRSVSHSIPSHYNSKSWSWRVGIGGIWKELWELFLFVCECFSLCTKGRLSAWLVFIQHTFTDFI